MRTLPAAAKYSDWGFGKMLSDEGFVDPPMPDSALKPTSGISASANILGLSIHDNDIENVRRGITLTDNTSAGSQPAVSISFNHIYDAWEYGIAGFGRGSIASLNIVGNYVDVDPYRVSPGRGGASDGWKNGYPASRCLYINYTGVVQLSLNKFSDCYSIQTSPSWVMLENIVRGWPDPNNVRKPFYWSPRNYGVGVFPSYSGEQFVVEPSTDNNSGHLHD